MAGADFWVRQQLTSQITRYDAPHAFQDTMVSGAFAFRQHDHFFRERADGVTEMRDVFRFAAPIPILGLIAERLVLAEYMRALLRERNAVTREVAESDRWAHTFNQVRAYETTFSAARHRPPTIVFLTARDRSSSVIFGCRRLPERLSCR